jgi:Fe2+ or Zn2+ uptake regulation protein
MRGILHQARRAPRSPLATLPDAMGLRRSSQDWAEQLAGRGLRATRQRVAVLRTLQADPGHPTALDVHQRLVSRHSTLSRKTVYEILDALVEVGLARRVTQIGGPARFEARPDGHYHVYCRVCGRLSDIPASADGSIRGRAELPAGFRVEAIQVTLEGRCRRCTKAI